MSFATTEEPGALQEFLKQWHEYRASIFAVATIAAICYKCLRALRALLRQETASIGPPKSLQKGNSALKLREQADSLRLGHGSSGAKAVAGTSTKAGPKRVSGNKAVLRAKKEEKNRRARRNSRAIREAAAAAAADKDSDIQVCIFYASLTGSTAQYAEQLKNELFSGGKKGGVYPKLSIPTPSNSLAEVPPSRTCLPPQIYNLEEIELDDYFVSLPPSPTATGGENEGAGEGKAVEFVYLVIAPSYEAGSPVAAFLDHLRETHHDFRIDSAPLRTLGGFSVFGFGDSSEWPESEGKFCKDAVQVDRWLGKLTGGRSGSRRMFPLGTGDVNPASGGDGDGSSGTAAARFREWRIHLEDALREYVETGELGGDGGWRTAVESGDEDSDDEAAVADEGDETEPAKALMDLEDLGGMINRSPDVLKTAARRPPPLPVDFTTPVGRKALEAGEGQSADRREMVPTDGITYKALTKQGYSIVGSHSGVKICRWTKSALRGRGSCYKFSFYGIKSHLCMETTPTLACSNKCVFCWRHGTNPVGTTWRWKVDPPEEIFKGVVEGHYRKIKMLKGVPGVRADRFSEAFRIRHCALSLVGEPIFYPYINEFLALLHGSGISSFLVCNAQHPAQLRALGPVTQLYVSIDASNRESLKRIDRPLHRDFWERFQECLDILREKRHRQRTVFRLTLVKGFNVDDEVKGYADLVERALPGFVEVKGVTYCGTSSAGEAGLTMSNVPFYKEVVEFVEALDAELARRGLEYGIAAEHEHSCCILIASKRFHRDGKWHTLIDYERFFALLKEHREFGPEEYVGEPTPEWANWGNGGFDPSDERVYRKGKGPDGLKKALARREGEGAGEGESGCG